MDVGCKSCCMSAPVLSLAGADSISSALLSAASCLCVTAFSFNRIWASVFDNEAAFSSTMGWQKIVMPAKLSNFAVESVLQTLSMAETVLETKVVDKDGVHVLEQE